jgi:hypothetical protein
VVRRDPSVVRAGSACSLWRVIGSSVQTEFASHPLMTGSLARGQRRLCIEVILSLVRAVRPTASKH